MANPHEFFCIFRQKLQVLCRNQARKTRACAVSKSRQFARPEIGTKSLGENGQISDMRKSTKPLRLDAGLRISDLITQAGGASQTILFRTSELGAPAAAKTL